MEKLCVLSYTFVLSCHDFESFNFSAETMSTQFFLCLILLLALVAVSESLGWCSWNWACENLKCWVRISHFWQLEKQLFDILLHTRLYGKRISAISSPILFIGNEVTNYPNCHFSHKLGISSNTLSSSFFLNNHRLQKRFCIIHNLTSQEVEPENFYSQISFIKN